MASLAQTTPMSISVTAELVSNCSPDYTCYPEMVVLIVLTSVSTVSRHRVTVIEVIVLTNISMVSRHRVTVIEVIVLTNISTVNGRSATVII